MFCRLRRYRVAILTLLAELVDLLGVVGNALATHLAKGLLTEDHLGCEHNGRERAILGGAHGGIGRALCRDCAERRLHDECVRRHHHQHHAEKAQHLHPR